MVTCPNCGRESPEEFEFCPRCGAALAAPASAREVRKTVTVVFCDVTGSTAMGERLDPESLRRVMSRYFGEMRTALERHGGTVEKFIGDAVMAVFGVPQLHEDDALRAVRAAADMRHALLLLNKELDRDHGVTLASRIGVNTGEIVAGDTTAGQAFVMGDAVNVAARLEQAAEPGEVLIGSETHRLVRDAVVVESVEPLDLKGKAERVAAFRLVDVTAGVEGVARRLDSPMVGRRRQLAQLEQAFEAAVADRSCQLFTVLGTPGVGKSRLVAEFLGGVAGRATILRGRCLPYGDGITFFPVSEVVKGAAGLEDFDAPEEVERKICAVLGENEQAQACSRLAQLFGVAGGDGATEETFWAVRQLLESVARSSPLVVVFDDIHWGEPTFLDLVEHISDWSRDAPILVLCMARPELLDVRPAWAGGKLNASTISLEPLSNEECGELIANLLGRAELPEVARSRILEAAEGTPLFVEQMLSMLIDDGLLARTDGHWVAKGDVSAVPVPSTIQALIAARLDRLAAPERAVIECAAVAGKQFHVGAIATLLAGKGADVDARAALRGLVRRDLIGPDRSLLAGEDAYRFRHLLVRDAAYEAIPKAGRAGLHERFAEWLIRVAGDRIEEQEEIAGYHLEQAYRLRADLGPIDEAAAGLGERAAEHLRASAGRASERGDFAAAGTLLGRAAELLPPDDPGRARTLYELSGTLKEVGDVAASFSAADDALRAAARVGDTTLEWLARIQRSTIHILKDPHGKTTDEVRAELEEAIRVFEDHGDEEGLATAWTELGQLHWLPCRFDAARHALDRAADHARRSGDRRLLQRAFVIGTAARMYGSTRPEEGIAAVEAGRAELGGSLSIEMILATAEGAFRALAGDVDEGRRLMEWSIDQARGLGLGFWIAAGFEALGTLELVAGDDAAAERSFRQSYQTLDELGDVGHKSTGAANIARTLCRLGRFDEAEGFTRIAREAGAQDDLITQVVARAAEARLASARGRHDEAVRLAREAVTMFADAESPVVSGDLWNDLAEVLRSAGKTVEAVAAARRALGSYERKGNEPACARVRVFLGELE